jgi:hypothetical protein
VLKRQQIREFGYADRRLGSYEENHLVPLDLGGAPYDERNLDLGRAEALSKNFPRGIGRNQIAM